MPLLPENSDVQGSLGPVARTPELNQEPTPAALDVLAEAGRQTYLGTAWDRMMNPRPVGKVDPGFDPIASIPKGYELYADHFVNDSTPEQVGYTRSRIDQELQSRKTIARAGGWGVAAELGTGLVDPVNLAAMAMVPELGASRIANAVRLAAVNAGTTYAQETLLGGLYELRTPQESLLNVGTSAIFGGLIGAAIRPRVPAGDLAALRQRLEAGQPVGPSPGLVDAEAHVPPPPDSAAAEEAARIRDAAEQLRQTKLPLEGRAGAETPAESPGAAAAAALPEVPPRTASVPELASALPEGQRGAFAPELDRLDYPNFGLAEPPKTLPAGHELLTERNLDNSPERVAMREGLVDQRFQDVAPVPEGQKPIAIVMGGGGASGKGTVLKMLADQGKVPENAVHLDPDVFKTGSAKAGLNGIPEYHQIVGAGDSRAAAVTHEESSLLYKAALDRAVKGRYNVVLDRTLGNPSKVLHPENGELKALKDAGYDVRLVGVTVPAEEAIPRLVKRANGPEKRYVPIDQALAAHKGFSQGFPKYADLADSALLFDNNVPKGEAPRLIASKAPETGKGLEIHDESAYNQFVKKGELNEKATTIRQISGERRPGEARPAERAAVVGPVERADRAGVGEAGPGGQGRGGAGEPEPGAGGVPGPRVEPDPIAAARASLESKLLGGPHAVTTPSGRKVDVRARLVELADLMTSDHPEFPQELQPRQRGERKALQAQVIQIAQKLDPELLGHNPLASDGAPIVSPREMRTGLEVAVPRTTTAASLEREFAHRDDAYWRIDETAQGSKFRDSSYSGTQCTGYACAVLQKLGKARVKVFGFGEENAASRIAQTSGGHDFAVVDGRYIVDPWLGEGFGTPMTAADGKPLPNRTVFDLEAPKDRAEIADIYGDRAAWKDMTSHVAEAAPPSRVVESGNGRVMALKHAYENVPESADRYRAWLERQGAPIEGMKQPVLVRERVTPMDMAERRAFTLEANQRSQAAFSPVEQARADARNLDAAVMGKLRGGDLTTGQNAPFIREFADRLPPGERVELVNADGTVSQAGVRRVQAAILAKAYGGTPAADLTLARMLEHSDSDIRSALNALQDAAPEFARLRQAIDDGKIDPRYDVAPAIVQAVEDVAKLRAEGVTLKEHLASADMFSPKTLATRAFYDSAGTRLAGREKAAAALIKYADGALHERLDQASLFTDAPASPAQLLHEATKPTPADMFGFRTAALKRVEATMASTPAQIPPADGTGAPFVSSPTGESTVGAATAGGARLTPMEEMTVARGARSLVAGPGRVAPGARLLTSPSLKVRQLLENLTNLGEVLQKNERGVANAIPIERLLWRHEGVWQQGMDNVGKLFRQYRERLAGQSYRIFPPAAEGALDRREFEQAIVGAMRRGDQHAIPEVAQAAADTRRIVFQPLYDRSVKLGLVPKDAQLFAESYMTRQYDAVKINGNRRDWHLRLRNYFISEGVDAAEADSIAHQATRNVLGSERGTMDWRMFADQNGVERIPMTGRLKGRTLAVPDTVLEPYLNNDLPHLTHSYIRSMAPEVEMADRFSGEALREIQARHAAGQTQLEKMTAGEQGIGEQAAGAEANALRQNMRNEASSAASAARQLQGPIQEIKDEYSVLIQRKLVENDNAGAVELSDRMDADIRDISAIRDRLYGVFGQPKDPGSFAVRAGRLLRQNNVLRLLGAATLAHIPDFANMVTRYGLPQTFSVVAKLATSMEAITAARAEAHRLGAALDMAMNTISVLGDFGSHSQYAEQRVGAKLTRAFTIATGETPLVTLVQNVASVIGQNEILGAAEKVAAGQAIDRHLAIRMAQAGLDEPMLQRVAREAATHGREVNGLRFGSSDAWADQEAALALETAILKDAHGMTLRPSVGDTPLLMSSEMGKLLLQFKTFAFAANRTVINPMMQGLARGDPRAAAGFMTLLVGGATSYMAKQAAAGQPLEIDNPARFALEVLDKSNLMGWTSEAIFPALWQFGFKDLSRWSDRDPIETLLGPSVGTVTSTLARRLPAKFTGDQEEPGDTFNRADLHFIRRTFGPGQNVWWFRRAVNDMEDRVGDTFDLPGTSNAERAQMRSQ